MPPTTRRALLAGAPGLGNLSCVAADGFEKQDRFCAQAKSRARWKYRAQRRTTIDFDAINRAAIAALPAVLARLIPGGKRAGGEYVALNPMRADRHLGSFKINLHTGRWSDFSTGDRGGDPVSLVAYLEGCSQGEAARRLARMLGLDNQGGQASWMNSMIASRL
jgi:hypothetical protein